MKQESIVQHISRQYMQELEDIRARVLAMGGMVEQQLADAFTALAHQDAKLGKQVIANDHQVDAMEVAIDEECNQILARRQPAASDLRLVIAVIKTITDLERIGDEAEKIARMAVHLGEGRAPRTQYAGIQMMGQHVGRMVHDALDAFARLDVEEALRVVHEDLQVPRECEGITRQLITFMMEDPRSITGALDALWSARALERIGDHARNIGEYVIFLVRGKDVRHTSMEQIEKTVHREAER